VASGLITETMMMRLLLLCSYLTIIITGTM
jgi:hypothetical protein